MKTTTSAVRGVPFELPQAGVRLLLAFAFTLYVLVFGPDKNNYSDGFVWTTIAAVTMSFVWLIWLLSGFLPRTRRWVACIADSVVIALILVTYQELTWFCLWAGIVLAIDAGLRLGISHMLVSLVVSNSGFWLSEFVLAEQRFMDNIGLFALMVGSISLLVYFATLLKHFHLEAEKIKSRCKDTPETAAEPQTVAASPPEPLAATRYADKAAADGVQQLQVLLVEDNPINQEITRKMLRKAGCHVMVVSDGQEAVELFASSPTLTMDLILMDCQMPGLDGYKTTEKLHQIWKKKGDPHIPLVALTASTMPEDKRKCKEHGMDDFLSKPVSYESLLACIIRWCPENRMEIAPLPISEKTAKPKIDERLAKVLFEPNTLRQMQEIMGERYVDMVEQFDINSRRIISDMQKNPEGDLNKLGQLSLDLRGASLAFGAKKLASLCQTLENQILINDSAEGLQKTINKIRELASVTVHQLQRV